MARNRRRSCIRNPVVRAIALASDLTATPGAVVEHGPDHVVIGCGDGLLRIEEIACRNGLALPLTAIAPAGSGTDQLPVLDDHQRRALTGIGAAAARSERPLLDALGSDALEMTAELYAERLGRSQRAVKVALLDQRAVAGIGNLYASEILHLAGVHPERACRELEPKQWQTIAAAALEVLELAVRYEGSTLSDGTYRNALNKSGGYQNEHRVYAKAGELCPRCKQGTIERIVQTQRSTFFCRRCQK